MYNLQNILQNLSRKWKMLEIKFKLNLKIHAIRYAIKHLVIFSF